MSLRRIAISNWSTAVTDRVKAPGRRPRSRDNSREVGHAEHVATVALQRDREAVDGDALRRAPRSRAGSTGGPMLLGPSPETSMTRRVPESRCSIEQGGRRISMLAEIDVPKRPMTRPGRDLPREGLGAVQAVDQRPGHDDLLAAGPGPFEIGDGDAADQPGLDRRDDLRVLDRLDIALALDLLLGGIHRARNVDGQHEFEIDLAHLRANGVARPDPSWPVTLRSRPSRIGGPPSSLRCAAYCRAACLQAKRRMGCSGRPVAEHRELRRGPAARSRRRLRR